MSRFPKAFLISSLCVLALVATFFIWKKMSSDKGADTPPPTLVVEATVLAPADFEISHNYMGTVGAQSFAILFPQGPGNVNKIFVSAGQSVKKGQTLVALENSSEGSQRDISRKNAELAKATFERRKKLFESGDITKASLEEAHKEWLRTKSAYESASQSVTKTEVKAPFDGIVGVPRVDIGQQVGTDTEIISMVKGPFYLKIQIPASELRRTKVGQSVKIDDVKGTIIALEEKVIDPKTKTSFAKVSLPGENYIYGESRSALVITDIKNGAMVLHRDAVFYKDKKPAVTVVKDGVAEIRFVTLGPQQNGVYEILSGLTFGEVVITANPQRAFPGAKVRVK